MVPGTVRVTEPGREGLREDRFRVTLVNGLETDRELLSSAVRRQPVDEVRVSAPFSMFGGTITEPGTGARAQWGQATWYDPPWSGYSAAHPFLPFGTQVVVTDLDGEAPLR